MSHGDERDDEPFPLPPKTPTRLGSTEPHHGPPTGPPELDTPELAALMRLHDKVDGLVRTVDSLFYLVQEERQERARVLARVEALEGPSGAPNGHG